MHTSGKIGIVLALTLVLTFPVSVISGAKPHKSKTITDLPLSHERSHGVGKRADTIGHETSSSTRAGLEASR
jgi:hypothetical protein